MNGKIYMLTNTITGLRYIGQTIQEVDARIRQGYKRTTHIGAAISRDGIGKITYQILETGITTQQKLDERENYYINLYRTLYPNGYNERLA